MSKPWKVVIVGGGFGGLTAARRLNSELVDVTLIDRRNYHLFQPLLYQVATTALSAGEVAAPIRGVLRRYSNVDVLLGEATDIDRVCGLPDAGRSTRPQVRARGRAADLRCPRGQRRSGSATR